MKTIAATIPTSSIAKDSNVKTVHSNVYPVTVLPPISVVMAIEIVAICLMKLIARHDSQEEDIVPNQDSNVTTTCVFHRPICVVSVQDAHRSTVHLCSCDKISFKMEPTIAATTQMNRQQFVRTSTVIR